jgi:hypothetical protein
MDYEKAFVDMVNENFSELKSSHAKLTETLEFVKDNMASKERVANLEAAHQRTQGALKVLSVIFTMVLAIAGVVAKYLPIK